MSDVLVGALGNTFAGIGTVFIVLILISLIIYCFNIIPVIQAKFAKKPEEASKAPVKAAPSAPAVVAPVAEEVPVAAIMAAIYAYEEANGYEGTGFYVRSIKRRR